MPTDTDSEGPDRSRLRGLALPSIAGAAGAGIALVLSMKPKRLRGAIAGLPDSAQDLAGDLKERVESFARSASSATSRGSGRGGGNGSEIDEKELEARRRERKKQRERRRQKATT